LSKLTNINSSGHSAFAEIAEPIPSFDLNRSLADIEAEITDAVQRVIRSQQVILGPEGRAFESEFADYVGATAAVGTASGTDALILALKAVGVSFGNEVITVANTAVPTASAIRAVGAVPRFIDVDEHSLLMNVDLIQAAINERTRAILPVHLYGLPMPMTPLLAIARRNNLRVIEDCAHAHGARENGIHVGVQGDAGCFSFYPTKNMGAIGDAGICVTRHPEIADRLRTLRMYGFDDDRIATCDGLNSRLDEIQAAVLRIRLRHLDRCLSNRNRIAAEYRAAMSAFSIVLPPTCNDRTHAWHQFVVRVKHRESFMGNLAANGIGCGIHYEHPLHRMPAFSPWFSDEATLPVTEHAAKHIVSIPISPWLRPDECDRVVSAVRGACVEEAAIHGGTA
jgi:dTDP-4-amino-4,6-dideoxygalactose transaminase